MIAYPVDTLIRPAHSVVVKVSCRIGCREPFCARDRISCIAFAVVIGFCKGGIGPNELPIDFIEVIRLKNTAGNDT